ncbi:hypothetical protein RFI_01266 [Reticulomyxa filosa]|uniref:Uncharacterized protein n=1 Tax=Reticulomyxa filosa TaxID=46433 RepID=X6PB64_RETFI|nr:hypothetical protein RFI_01266 [Reticulomyxa filosa]|eukprot:ETO35795.1 hypothetical protein RFI_01266 [Reticulomyxa filosa]
MRLLCDTLFLVICDKLVMIMCCTNDGQWRMDTQVTCWKGEHLIIATLALIGLSYYIPFCVMVSPMFVELGTPLSGSCKDYLSLTSTIEFIKPYLSLVTWAKCCMLVSAQLISAGNPVGTVVSQFVTCLVLFLLTAIWSWTNLNLSQYHKVSIPVFPYGISVLKSLGFLAGVIGSVIELFFVYRLLPNTIFGTHLNSQNSDMLYVLALFVVSAAFAVMFFVRLKYIAKKNMSIYSDLEELISIENIIM